MTSLEERLLKNNTRWVFEDAAFTAVVGGHAFALYRESGLMRLCGLTKKDTTQLLADNNAELRVMTSFWFTWPPFIHDRMFDIVASSEFVGQVVLDAHPELAI